MLRKIDLQKIRIFFVKYYVARGRAVKFIYYDFLFEKVLTFIFTGV